jgi:anti-anti-sigma factor
MYAMESDIGALVPAAAVARVEVMFARATGEARLRLEGRTSVGQVDALERALLRLNALRPKLVRLDLSDLQSVSSLALGVLALCCRGVVRAGGRVQLAPPPSPEVAAALGRAGLLDWLDGAGAETH